MVVRGIFLCWGYTRYIKKTSPYPKAEGLVFMQQEYHVAGTEPPERM